MGGLVLFVMSKGKLSGVKVLQFARMLIQI